MAKPKHMKLERGGRVVFVGTAVAAVDLLVALANREVQWMQLAMVVTGAPVGHSSDGEEQGGIAADLAELVGDSGALEGSCDTAEGEAAAKATIGRQKARRARRALMRCRGRLPVSMHGWPRRPEDVGSWLGEDAAPTVDRARGGSASLSGCVVEDAGGATRCEEPKPPRAPDNFASGPWWVGAGWACSETIRADLVAAATAIACGGGEGESRRTPIGSVRVRLVPDAEIAGYLEALKAAYPADPARQEERRAVAGKLAVWAPAKRPAMGVAA